MAHAEGITLIRGSEAALGDREVARIRTQVLSADPSTEVTKLSAVGYQPGRLQMICAPSLFEEARLIILDDLDRAGAACVEDVLAYIAQPASGVQMLLRHRGGNKNRKIIDAAKKAGATMIECAQLRNDRAKIQLVQEEAKACGGTISARAAAMIVDAVGRDLYEVLGAVRQLVSDYGPRVADDDIQSFFAGQTEATAFEVADAIVGGQGPRALLLYRQARSVGVEDIPLLGAVAMKFRDMALASAGSAPAGYRGTAARESLRRWDDDQLGQAMCFLAQADSVLKGAPGSADHAIEKCIIDISRLRSNASR